MESTYDIKDDFMSLLERKNDFSGAEYLRNYFNEYKAEKISEKRAC